MTKKEKRPLKSRNYMSAGDIQVRDYASCKMARQFWGLLYGARQQGKVPVNGEI